MPDDVDQPQPPAAPPAFTVDVARNGPAVLLTPRGEVDMRTAAQLQSTVDDALSSDAARIVIDLGPCSFMDSSGLAVVVRLFNTLREDPGRELQLHPGPPQVQRVFEVSGLDQILAFVSR